MLRMYESTQFEQHEKMLMKQKMVDMMEQFKKQEIMNEFWRDVNAEQKEASLQNITMKFDLKNNLIELESETKNAKGDPLFEWKLDANTGEIVEATRQVDSATERIIER